MGHHAGVRQSPLAVAAVGAGLSGTLHGVGRAWESPRERKRTACIVVVLRGLLLCPLSSACCSVQGQGTVAAVTVTRCEDGGVMLPPRHLLHDAGKAVRRGKGKDADKVEAVMKLTKTTQVHRTWSMQVGFRVQHFG